MKVSLLAQITGESAGDGVGSLDLAIRKRRGGLGGASSPYVSFASGKSLYL